MAEKHPFDDFGINLFSECVMKECLPHPIYKKWKTATRKEDALDRPTADAIAHAMKTWAMDKGATHFTHWFQPLTGSTAEKHDSFIEPGDHDQPISRFSGKSLIKGEGDASSFPSGGLRATFEARGYTYWDCTSPAFLRDNVLCIPTIFVSYNGETLDKKAPLLKSAEAISKQATRIVNLFKDKDIKHVNAMVGLEQEYFLIDKRMYLERKDLVHTGRTLFGSMPPKSMDIRGHYFGSIPSRVQAFMTEVDEELWKLGIYAKTEHNEVAPCQFEIAPLFIDANVAVDQNLIIMDVLKKKADKHGMACLLHEKPFQGVNGSGKHNNWSLVTDDGQNLLEPGDRPHENIRFLLFVCAIIEAVDTYPELLRMAASCYGNDYRLGADEAPPAVVSICMGDELEIILEKLRNGEHEIKPDVETQPYAIANLSYVPKDTSDRNRTSPFAFTGNKFEFRMVGSSRSASTTNIILNSIVADSLRSIADTLQQYKYIDDIRKKSLDICRDILRKHSRILFSKDGYSEEWLQEAQERGLPNIKHYVDSIYSMLDDKAVEMFERNKVYDWLELEARVDILTEEYRKSVKAEVLTLLDISKKDILPALVREIKFYTDAQNSLGTENSYYQRKIKHLCDLLATFDERYHDLKKHMIERQQYPDNMEKAQYLNQVIVPKMEELRAVIDAIEEAVSSDNYPFPTYDDMFISMQ
ncbi:glutamine synthetase III [[Clostridium] innocuum]|nr:glutamine synthetase III [[Clostridium] innocuum]MCR0323224.1 glutamine synthetase III [[Clostridium] innocuum]